MDDPCSLGYQGLAKDLYSVIIFSLTFFLCIYTECEYMISGKRKYLALRSLARFSDKTFFIALSVSEHFYFRSFHPSLTGFAVVGPPFIFLSLPPPFSVMAIS